MRRLILKMSLSLDGFVAGPNGETDWMLRGRDDGGRRWVEETLRRSGLHAVGRRTFQDWAGYWPGSGDPLAAAMNDLPKVVFTRQAGLDLSALPAKWNDAEVASGELSAEMTRLKRQPGRDILAQGGAGFAQSLVASGLVDEYRLVVHPVVLGTGLPLFARLARPLDLTLVGTTLFRSGTAAHVYRPAVSPGRGEA